MLNFLSKEVQEGLEMARKTGERRKSRLRVQVGEAVFPVLRFWHDGMVLDATLTPHLRGLVDVYDGARHVFQCLIVASVAEGDELICDFKRLTIVDDKAPLDFWRDENTPVGYLPRA
jgi:hypothetical protein